MKKNVKKVLLGTLIGSAILAGGTGITLGQTVASAADTYTLTFEGGRGVRSIEETGDWFWAINGRKETVTNDLSPEDVGGIAIKYTKDDASDPYLGGYSKVDGYTAGVTYTTAFWLKTEAKSDDFAVKAWMPDSSFATVSMPVITTVSGNTDWTRYEYTWTANTTSGGTAPLRFSVTAGQGSLYVDEVDTYQSVYTVTNGSAIGTVPNLPKQNGKSVAWMIDGEEINASTIYNYTENKTAVAVYEEKYTLSFAYPDMIENMKSGDFGAVYNASYELTETGASSGKALHYTVGTVNTGNAASPWICLSSSTVPAGEYVVKFKMKNSRYVNVQYQINSYDYSSTTMLQANVSTKDAWTEYEYTINLASDASSLYLLPQAHAGAGDLYIDDLYFGKKLANSEDRALEPGAKIGTLPVADEKEGYKAVWTIDGEEITADTVWNYKEDKTAVLSYVQTRFTLSFEYPIGMEDGEIKDNGYNLGAKGALEFVTEGSLYGSALKYTVNETGVSGAYVAKAFDVEAGKTYVFSYYMNITESNSLEMSVYAEGSAITAGDNFTDAVSGVTNGWVYREKVFTPNASGNIIVYFRAGHGSGGNGTVYIDEIYVREKLGDPINANAGETIGTLPEPPEKEFYVGAWTIDGEVINSDTVWAYDGNKAAKFAYTAIEYTVSFVADDTTVSTATYTVENTEIEVPAVPEKEGYTGAWEAYELNGGDKTIKVVYTAIEYTVSFVADGETVGTVTYTVENKEIIEPDVPEKAGYTGTWKAYELTTGNVTVEANYAINTYTVTFVNKMGNAIAEPITFTVDTIGDVVFPEAPDAGEGWVGGWNISEADLTLEDTTVYYAPKMVEYTVTFVNKMGNAIADPITFTVETKDSVEFPEAPDPEMEGWVGAWSITAADLTLENTTVYYAPKMVEYTVTFVNKAGMALEGYAPITFTVETKDSVEFPELPAQEEGWEAAWAITPADLALEDTQVTLIVFMTEYTITFMADGEVVGTATYYVEDKDNIVEPAVPEKEGYTGAWEAYELTTGDITVNAVYTEIPVEPEVPGDSEEPEVPSEPEEGKKKKKGCGSSLGLGMAGALTAVGAALVIKKRKEN